MTSTTNETRLRFSCNIVYSPDELFWYIDTFIDGYPTGSTEAEYPTKTMACAAAIEQGLTIINITDD